MKRLICLLLVIIALASPASAGQESKSTVTVLVSIEAPTGKGIAVGTIGVGLVKPDGKFKYRNDEVDTAGHCVLELDPNMYGIRWNTKDSLRPIRVELDGDIVDNYPVFIKEYESEGERSRAVGGRSIGAEVALIDKPRTLRFVVPEGIESHRVVGTIRDSSGNGIRTRCDLYRGDAMNCARCGDTDDSGRFEFVARKFPFKLVPRDYTGLWNFRPAEVDLSGPIAGILRFEAVPRTVHRLDGVVVDQESREPISAVWIAYKQECLDQWIEGRVKSDGNGSFEVSCYPGCGMTIDSRHFENQYYPVSLALPPRSCEQLLTVEMEPK